MSMRKRHSGVLKAAPAGTLIAGAEIKVYLDGTSTPANVYTAPTGGTAASAMVTDDRGHYEFWVDPLDYPDPAQLFKITYNSVGGEVDLDDNVQILDEQYASEEYVDAAIAAAGGGGGRRAQAILDGMVGDTVAAKYLDILSGTTNGYLAVTSNSDTLHDAGTITGTGWDAVYSYIQGPQGNTDVDCESGVLPSLQENLVIPYREFPQTIYPPGMRLHSGKALQLGAGSSGILTAFGFVVKCRETGPDLTVVERNLSCCGDEPYFRVTATDLGSAHTLHAMNNLTETGELDLLYLYLSNRSTSNQTAYLSFDGVDRAAVIVVPADSMNLALVAGFKGGETPKIWSGGTNIVASGHVQQWRQL